ncbi:hypothetical protein ACL58G_18120 [Massilia sp. GER05]
MRHPTPIIHGAGDYGFGMRTTGAGAGIRIEHFTRWVRASKLVP